MGLVVRVAPCTALVQRTDGLLGGGGAGKGIGSSGAASLAQALFKLTRLKSLDIDGE